MNRPGEINSTPISLGRQTDADERGQRQKGLIAARGISEVRDQSQRSEVRSQRSEIRGQKSEPQQNGLGFFSIKPSIFSTSLHLFFMPE